MMTLQMCLVVGLATISFISFLLKFTRIAKTTSTFVSLILCAKKPNKEWKHARRTESKNGIGSDFWRSQELTKNNENRTKITIFNVKVHSMFQKPLVISILTSMINDSTLWNINNVQEKKIIFNLTSNYFLAIFEIYTQHSWCIL